jgi:RNA polymerase sigma-70 factor, ECF subfamily
LALYTCEMVPDGSPARAWDREVNLTYEESDSRARTFSQEMAAGYVHLIRLAYLLCGDWSAAEDLVAEAYARAWTRWSQGTVEDLRAYTRRILVNLSLARRRRAFLEQREGVREVSALPVPELADDVARRLDVTRALRELAPKLRVVAVLRFYEDLGEEEVARVLGIKVGTVKSRASRAVQALRPLIEGEIRA